MKKPLLVFSCAVENLEEDDDNVQDVMAYADDNDDEAADTAYDVEEEPYYVDMFLYIDVQEEEPCLNHKEAEHCDEAAWASWDTYDVDEAVEDT
jgi:hypothetical protein